MSKREREREREGERETERETERERGLHVLVLEVSVRESVCVCPSIYLSVCLPVYLFIYPSVDLSTNPIAGTYMHTLVRAAVLR